VVKLFNVIQQAQQSSGQATSDAAAGSGTGKATLPQGLHHQPMHSEIARKGKEKDRRTMRLGGPSQVRLGFPSFTIGPTLMSCTRSGGFSGEYTCTIWRGCIENLELPLNPSGVRTFTAQCDEDSYQLIFSLTFHTFYPS
jgi:hypothetical protein